MRMMDELSDKIISGEHFRFLKGGIKWLDLDHVASDCNISRKTLNKYFKRQGLIEAVISQRLEAYRQSLRKIGIDQLEPLGEMRSLLVLIEGFRSDFSAILLRDLRRYYNEYWLLIDSFIKGSVKKVFVTNLTNGISLGNYRKTINVELLTDVYFVSLIALIENEPILQPGPGSNRLRVLNDNFLAGLIDHK